MTTEDIILTDAVETFSEKQGTSFGDSAKVDAPKKIHGQTSLCHHPQRLITEFSLTAFR